MRRFLFFLVAMSPLLLPAKSIEQRPNVLLICVDDLRPELKCFGVDYIHSPNIDALAARGRAFHQKSGPQLFVATLSFHSTSIAVSVCNLDFA